MIASLSPEMKLKKEIAPVLKASGLPVSPISGGPKSRTKVIIVDEARALVGLPPFYPPMGMAVEPDKKAWAAAEKKELENLASNEAQIIEPPLAAKGADAPSPPSKGWLTGKCLLIGCSILMNATVLLLAVAAAGVSYGARAALPPVVDDAPAVFDDMGERLHFASGASVLLPILVFLLVFAPLGLDSWRRLTSSLTARRLRPFLGRVCPLIPPTGYLPNARATRRIDSRIAAAPLDTSVTIHTHRRHAAKALLRENVRELGPIWLSLFFLVEWGVAAALDAGYRPAGLSLHPHALPRQSDLTLRWREGACRRCIADTADITSAGIRVVLRATLLLGRATWACHSLACELAARVVLRSFRTVSRMLGSIAWLMCVVTELVWAELACFGSWWVSQNVASMALLGVVGCKRALTAAACTCASRLHRAACHFVYVLLLRIGTLAWITGIGGSSSSNDNHVYETQTQPHSRRTSRRRRQPLPLEDASPPPPTVGYAYKAPRATSEPTNISAQGKAYERVRARAALTKRQSRATASWRAFLGAVTLSIIVDSGCTWHSHPEITDLINVRPCDERIACADGVEHRCTAIGDLPLVAINHTGRECTVLLRDVRCVPSFTDTLLSIEQLWTTSRIDVVFRNRKCLVQVDKDDNELVALPFAWKDGLYRWEVGAVAHASLRERPPPPPRRSAKLASCPSCGDAGAIKGEPCYVHHSGAAMKSKDATGVHGAHASSHLEALSPNELAAVLHRRLHVSLNRIRRLVTVAADVPSNAARADRMPCDACAEANSTRVPHSGQNYRPSHVGRLIHADIVGPFKNSADGRKKWMLVLVDDHSRYKFVYFMRTKAEAPKMVRRFVAKFNAMTSRQSGTPVRVVGSLHSDNAGEFVSRQFQELMDEHSIDHTTSPPHIHQLNGVAERAIRSIMDQVRVDLLASGLGVGHWTYAANHAVDIINRTTGPPDSDKSSYEHVTGERPRVLPIMPLGCRAFVVKPEAFVRKSEIPTRAWKGVNLGRVPSTPGAYYIHVKSTGRVHVTSDIYFAERHFPLRPKGSRHVGPDVPTRAPSGPAQPPGVPPAVPSSEGDVSPTSTPASEPVPPSPAPPVTLAEAYERATRGRPRAARASRHVLLLFSGPYDRPDGLAIFLRRLGLEVTMVDNDGLKGDGRDDLSSDAFYQRLLERATAGEFLAVIAAPPCSTFSISRFMPHRESPDGRGPPVLRTKRYPEGVPEVPAGHSRELRIANRLVRRMAYILGAATAAGSEILVENPPTRNDPAQEHLFMHAEHSSLWDMPVMRYLQESAKCLTATFAQCRFSADSQKYTTFMYSPGFESSFSILHTLLCDHPTGTHSATAGGLRDADGKWNSADAAAFPADLNLFIAQGVAALITDAAVDAPNGGVDDDIDITTADRDVPLGPAADRRDAAPPPPAEPSPSPPPPSPPPAPTPRAPSTPRQPRSSLDPLRFRKEAPRQGPIPTRGAIRRGEVADPLAEPADDASAAAVDSSGAFTVRLIPSRVSSALHHIGSAFLAAPSAADPKSRKEALKMDKEGWMAAERKELDNHALNKSWSLIDRSHVPAGRRLVRLIWVYKIKRSGALKARLCVQGCTQVAGVDFDQTFCATMRSGSLRLLCALAARHDLNMRRWDFVSAYLQGELLEDEVVYCQMPPGYELSGRDGRQRVCRVEKPIYGMAQSGRRWQRTIFPWLLDAEQGFTQSDSDSCVFYRSATVTTPNGPREEKLIVGVYVDDLFVLSSCEDEHSLYHSFVERLQSSWEVEDEGPVSDLLNVEITKGDGTVTLRQTAYIDKLIETYCPNGVPTRVQSTSTPCDDSVREHLLTALGYTDAPDPTVLRQYQSLVGALLYCATNTRPDIAYAVGLLCRAMAKPTQELLDDARHVLYYLHRHRDVGLTYETDSTALFGMSDSDWAVKHSTSGCVFVLNKAAISWGSRKQPTVALSSCEAELMAASEAAKEAVYLDRFLGELGESSGQPVALHVDNKGARDLAYNPEHHQKVKHIERRHFYVRELVEQMRITVPYVASADNLSDFFTKPLKAPQFFAMRDVIMNHT